MTEILDLDAYLARIGHTGGRGPTLDTLAAIQARHTAAIAFENLDPLLGWPVRLDLASLQAKIVEGGRGGYCYEQNLLLGHALRALGFRVTDLAARVLWNQPEGAVTPRSHMLLRVDFDGAPWLVDGGFGGLTPTGPLRLVPDIEQATPHEVFRLVRAAEDFVLQARIRESWKPLYRFDLQRQLLPDYEICNWYLSTHPNSHFTQRLFVARPDADRRYALLNNEFTVHHRDGASERRVLSSAAALRDTLEGIFGLRPPDAPALDAVLARVAATPG